MNLPLLSRRLRLERGFLDAAAGFDSDFLLLSVCALEEEGETNLSLFCGDEERVDAGDAAAFGDGFEWSLSASCLRFLEDAFGSFSDGSVLGRLFS